MADFSNIPPEKRERMCKMLLNRYKRCVGTTLLDNPMDVTDKCGGLYLDMTDLCGDDLAVSYLPSALEIVVHSKCIFSENA